MDYTTKEYVKSAIGADTTVDDTRLSRIVTQASRSVDRYCTGAVEAVDYFKLEDVVGEKLRAQIDYNGRIICFPRKPIVNSVASFSYAESVATAAYSVEVANIMVAGIQVEAYANRLALTYPSRCWVTISYNGGLSGSSTTLPDDLINAVTLLAVRYYREEETGLTDAIGVAELGTMVYTKAWPTRVIQMLEPFRRRVGWRFVA